MELLFDGITLSIPISKGNIFVSVTGIVPDAADPIKIKRAMVTLPDGVTGMVNTILIVGPDGRQEFLCSGSSVENGTDLIAECGEEFIILSPGLTSYTAQGSDFAEGGQLLEQGMLTVILEQEFA